MSIPRRLGSGGGSGGDVVGPASSTDNAIARFDSTTGKLLKNSGNATVSDAGAAVFADSVRGGYGLVQTLYGTFAAFQNYAQGEYCLLQSIGGESYFNCASGTSMFFRIGNTNQGRLQPSGNWYLGTGTPGDAHKLEVGGALKADSINLGGATLLDVLSATASLNFGSIAAGASADLTITVTGAVAGDSVELGRPAAQEAGLITNGICTADDTVTVRAFNNNLVGSIDQAALTYRATVLKL